MPPWLIALLFVVRAWLKKDYKIQSLLVGPLVGIIVVILFQVPRNILFHTWKYYWSTPDFMLIGITISALLVHLWLPLLVLCIGLLKLLNYLRKAVGWTQWFLKGGKQHPLDAVGYVAAVVVFATTVTLQRIF